MHGGSVLVYSIITVNLNELNIYLYDVYCAMKQLVVAATQCYMLSINYRQSKIRSKLTDSRLSVQHWIKN